jgi:hypothetical protein
LTAPSAKRLLECFGSKSPAVACQNNKARMELDEFLSNTSSSQYASLSPTVYLNPNATGVNFTEVEEEHELDAITVLLMNLTLIGCLLLAYYVKQYRIYYLPERYVMSLVLLCEWLLH